MIICIRPVKYKLIFKGEKTSSPVVQREGGLAEIKN